MDDAVPATLEAGRSYRCKKSIWKSTYGCNAWTRGWYYRVRCIDDPHIEVEASKGTLWISIVDRAGPLLVWHEIFDINRSKP